MADDDFEPGTKDNGANILPWIVRWILPIVLAYFTAQGAIEKRVTKVETNEAAHYEEMKRAQSDSAADIKSDIRELRTEIRELMKAKNR